MLKSKLSEKLYLYVFVIAAMVFAWGVWFNYRPHVILASCADIAEKTVRAKSRFDIENRSGEDFDMFYYECLSSSGIY